MPHSSNKNSDSPTTQQHARFVPNVTHTVSIQNLQNEDNRLRKFDFRNTMLNDDFYNQTTLELGNVYEAALELGLITQIDDTNNLFRMVMEEISKVYHEEPMRKFDEAAQEDMTELYKQLEVSKIMKQSNLYMNAFNDVLVQVGTADEKLKLRLRRPDNTVVETDSDLNLTTVYIFISNPSAAKNIWWCYTDTELFEVEVGNATELHDIQEADKKIIKGRSDKKNPLGFIPFMAIHNGFRDSTFWQKHKGDDLVKGTIQVAIKLTFLNHLIKNQAFKQLVASGSGLRTALNKVVLDPQTIVFLEGVDTSIEALDLTADYKGLWETIESINNHIATNYKISSNFFRITASPTSGFGLQMENVRLDGFISSQQTQYVEEERKLFELMKRVDEKQNLGLIKGEAPTVTFEGVTYPESEIDVLTKKEKRINLGLSKPTDFIEEERNVTEEEAVVIFEENIKQRNKMNGKFNDTALNLDTTKDALVDANNGQTIQTVQTPAIDPKDVSDDLAQNEKIFKYHIDSGMVTINEVRKQLGLKPIAGGDKFISTITNLTASTNAGNPAKKPLV